MEATPNFCPKCGAPLIPLLDERDKPVIVFGRAKWVCSRYEAAPAPCDFVSLRNRPADEQACCPHCGCLHLMDDKVTHSEIKGGSRRRRRVCRNCGLSVFTREVIEAPA